MMNCKCPSCEVYQMGKLHGTDYFCTEGKPEKKLAQHHKDGALALLALLQREGRFVDFVRDSVDGASDADIGAAS